MSILASLHVTQPTNIFIQWPGVSPLASHFVGQHIDMAPARGHPTRQRGESPMTKSEWIVDLIDTPSQKTLPSYFNRKSIIQCLGPVAEMSEVKFHQHFSKVQAVHRPGHRPCLDAYLTQSSPIAFKNTLRYSERRNFLPLPD